MTINSTQSILLKLIVVITVIQHATECAKILGVFPAPGQSQYIAGSGLLIPLAEKGHDVTVISMFETKGVKNYKNVLIDRPKVKAVGSEDMFAMRRNNIFQNVDVLYTYSDDLSERTLSDKNVQRLIHSNETFDLVIAETIYCESLFVFATHFKAKLILLNTMGLTEFNGHLIGNPLPPSFVPTMMSGYTSHMNFYERTRNTLTYLYDAYKRTFFGYPRQQIMVDKFFPKKYDIHEIIHKAEMLFVNGHYSITEVLPVTHAVKEIAGFHVRSKPLPDDIKKFLDTADKGAVLFSLGSNLKTSDLPKPVLERLLKEFSKLDQRILWKFEAPALENKPKNVFISKWLPQSDIIAHPNLVGFISHGGLLSIIEATYYAVPIVGVPVFADQEMNVLRTVKSGAGIFVPFEQFGEEGVLVNAVREIVNNPRFKEKASERSKLLHDRIVSPVEEAIFWVEHVLKNNNTNHLRSPTLELNWYQVYLLDVAAVFIGAILAVVAVVLAGFKIIFKLVERSKTHTKGSKKNK